MRILVCGGRDYGDLESIHPVDSRWLQRKAEHKNVMRVLTELSEKHSAFYKKDDNWLPSDIVIIHGGARGADSCADQWAVTNWSRMLDFPADWEKYGKSAGPIRNQQMLDEGKPDLVVAFPGGKGTADMVKRAKKAGIEVIEVPPFG